MQDDVLIGTQLDEIFSGQGGNDVIFGRVGNDLFEDSGADGNDLYVGGGGEDRLSVALSADAYNVAQTFIGLTTKVRSCAMSQLALSFLIQQKALPPVRRLRPR